MSNIEYSPELAAALDRLVPAVRPLQGDWDDVVARAGRRPRRPARLARKRRLRLVLALIAVFLLLTGIATATYLATRASQPAPSLAAVAGDGRLRTIWRCPTGDLDCGAFVVDAALSRDGRHLALVTTSGNSLSLYQGGIHVVDLTTGADRQLPPAPPGAQTQAAQLRAWRQHYRAATRALGCAEPHELAWSPDGSLLAYTCAVRHDGYPVGRIYTIRPDGTDRQLLHTDTPSAYWPTWSPDGKRIAFSTGPMPVVHVGRRAARTPGHRIWSAIYSVDRNGARKTLIVQRGAAPDWSPDGTTIAYWAPACTGDRNQDGRTRLVAPDGRDVTPEPSSRRCGGIGPPSPVVSWSPDGSRLAVRAGRVYVMNADGSDVTSLPATDGFGDSRPVWQPTP